MLRPDVTTRRTDAPWGSDRPGRGEARSAELRVAGAAHSLAIVSTATRYYYFSRYWGIPGSCRRVRAQDDGVAA